MENEFSNFGKPNNAGNTAQPPRGWFSRNMWWFLPMLLLMLLSPCICCGGLYSFVVGTVKGSEPYKLALERVQKDPQVIQEIGQPIEQSGWMLGGKVDDKVENGGTTGHSELEFDVAGPKGKAHVRSEQISRNGHWTFQTLEVTPASTGKTMSLLSVEKPEKPEAVDEPDKE